MKEYTREELLKIDAVEVYKLVLAKQINKFPNGFWQQIDSNDKATKCVRWLIEEKLELTKEALKQELSCNLFRNNRLSGMMKYCFNNSPYKAVDAAYPNEFYPWEFKRASVDCWNDIQDAICATRWLVEVKLKLNKEQLKEQISYDMFKDNGLAGMLKKYFKSSPIKAIETAYSDELVFLELGKVTRNCWSDIENGKKATRWLIEKKLKLTEEDLKKKLSSEIFKENGLGGMLQICFESSPYKAINAAYPGKYRKEDFRNYRRSGKYKVKD